MYSRRKVSPLNSVQSEEFLTALARSSMEASDQEKLEKDALIINAALSSDMIIVTQDEKLKRTMEKYPRLANISSRITWVNPQNDDPAVFEKI